MRPAGIRMPWGTRTILVSSLSMAITEVSSPLWVYSRHITSILPWTPPPHFLAQRLDLGAGRATEIEQKVAMLFRHLGVADPETPAARRVDQRPSLVTRRILEGRAPGAAPQRLRFLASASDRVHLRAD